MLRGPTNAHDSRAAVYLSRLPAHFLNADGRAEQKRAHPLPEVLGGVPPQERADEEPRPGAKAGQGLMLRPTLNQEAFGL